METPNTRARRKRERELEDEGRKGSGVVWRQDDLFKQEFLMQTADDPLPMPAPTQRAPQIGSSSSSFAGSTVGSTKRTRRVRSSLPGSISSAAPPPAAPGTDRNRLDELLDRFLDISSRPESAAPSSTSASTPRTSTASTSRTSLSSTSSASRALSDGTNRARALASTRSLPDVKGDGQNLRATKSAPRQLVNRLATNQARSSPRRAAAVAHPSPLRAPVPPPPPFHAGHGARAESTAATSLSTRSRTGPTAPQPPTAAAASRSTRSSSDQHTPAKPTTRNSAPLPPQPSSDGDTSIDSLDMAFEHGGEDVERLFSLLDGV